MKRLLSLLAFAGLCHGAQLDVDGVGADLNGWSGGTARYSLSGANFEVTRPTTATDANGNLIVTTTIRELKRTSPVFEGTLRALISPDGVVRTLSIEGKVDGKSFETGETTRPEPVAPTPVAEGDDESAAAGSVVDVTPVNPEQDMRDSLGQSLRSAIERARASEKVVKRDLSAWIFSPDASDAEVLAEGVDTVVRSLLRRSGRS